MISIIIPVKNDRKIEETLKNLKKIKKPEKTEIVVVDASEGNLDDIKRKFPYVRWIYFHNKTNKRYTFTEQINLGLKNAKGDLIAFIDADCIPDKNWLIELARPIRNEGEDYVTGLVKPIGGRSIHDAKWKNIDKNKYRSEAGSANSIFKKKILSEIGFYDERFEAGSDKDFSWRAIDAGYKIRYNNKAIIFDHWGNLKQEIKRAFRYAEAQVRLYKKHPNRWKNLLNYQIDLFTVYSIIYFIYIISLLPITFIFPYYPLFLLIPIMKNIKRGPFKKLLFDFSWGLGILKELIFPQKNDPKK